MSAFHPDHESKPLILNLGAGVDSTAIVVELVRLYGLGDVTARPVLIIFADTGDELPETYENVERVSDWCQLHGFPRVTVVSRPRNVNDKTGDKSLSQQMIRLETLPSEAFGGGSCSVKWKHEPMDRFLFGYKRPQRTGWLEANGLGRPTKLVGYDATEAGCPTSKRGKNAKLTAEKKVYNDKGEQIGGDRYDFRYPLVEWGWTRQDCVEAIEAAGLPVPIKSACAMCPNQQPEELTRMATDSPRQLLRALAMEVIAERGRHGLRKLEGLWRVTRKRDNRPGSWVLWAQRTNILAQVESRVGQTLEELVCELKPHLTMEQAQTA